MASLGNSKLLTGSIKRSVKGSTIIEVLVAMVIILASFGVLLLYGTRIGAEYNRTSDGFKEFYATQVCVEHAKGNDLDVFQNNIRLMLLVEDTIIKQEDLVLYRVFSSRRMNKMMPFYDFYLNLNEE